MTKDKSRKESLTAPWLDAWAEFNREHLSRPDDRRRLAQEALGLAVILILIYGLICLGAAILD
jgi:hypothetical protein